MKFLDLFRRGEKRTSLNPAGLFSAAWDVLTNTHTTSAGEPINDTIALRHVTVYVCVRVIAEAIGSMTLRTYKRIPKGRQEALDDPIHRILSVEPNSEMSAPVVWESVAGCMALTGNSYLEILRNVGGTPVGLYPLDPRQTEPVRLPNGQLAYKTRVGVKDGQQRTIKAADMLHFPLFSFDGLKGLSPVGQARNSVALAIAAEKYGAKFFGNSSRPGGILTPVGEVGDEDLANMRGFWEKANSAENQGRIGVVSSDWKYTALSLSPEESQFLQTRQLSRTDIAALFCIAPSRVGDVTKQSKASAEQENLSFVIDTLRPYLVRIECEIQRKLLPRDGSMFVEFSVDERLRGDFATTMQGFAIGKQWGFYSTNYVLEKLGENPIGPEGDIRWAPVNMTNAANLIAPAPDPSPEPLLDPPIDPATESQRSMFDAYLPAFASLFQDAVGRVASRSKKDTESVTPILSPLVESITSVVIGEARKQFSLADDWTPSDKIAKEYIKSASMRAPTWTAENRNESASAELYKALRSIHIGLYREAGAAVALRNTHAEN